MARWLIALLALALLPVPLAHAQTSKQGFRTEMIGRLGKEMPDATLTPKPGDPLAIIVKGGPWDEAQINLDRIFNYCQQASAADCESEKAQFITVISAKPDAVTPASLRLVVRDQQYVDSANSMGGGKPGEKPDGLILEPLGGGLYAILTSDSPKALRLIMGAGLKELGMSRADAWALARRQTEADLPPIPTATDLKNGAVVFEDHEFGASLLINLPAWTKLAAEVGPDLFVTVVSDRIVFVGILPDGPKLESFKKSVEEDCQAQPRCISPYIYRFRNGRWAIAD